jgi:hypothetical protein
VRKIGRPGLCRPFTSRSSDDETKEEIAVARDEDLLFTINKSLYFQGMTALGTSQLLFWTWYNAMDFIAPVQVELPDWYISSPIWGYVGLGAGMVFTYFIPMYARNYVHSIRSAPGSSHVDVTCHTPFGTESAPRNIPRHRLSSHTRNDQYISVNIAGDNTYLILDKTGEIYDKERLLLVLNHTENEPDDDDTDEGSGGGTDGQRLVNKKQNKVSGIASEAARKRLQELNDTPQFVEFVKETTHTNIRDFKRKKKKGKAAKGAKTPKNPKRGKGGRFV